MSFDWQFHLLDGLEPSSNLRLSEGTHRLAVYGDNWFQVTYSCFIITVSSSGQ